MVSRDRNPGNRTKPGLPLWAVSRLGGLAKGCSFYVVWFSGFQTRPFRRNGADRFVPRVRAGRVLLHVRARARQSIMQSMLMQRNAVTIRGARPADLVDADARDGGAHVGSYWSRGTQVGRACWREIRRNVCCRGARRSSGFESRALGRTVKRENIACIACSQTRSHKHATPPAAPLKRAICGPCPSPQPRFACTPTI